MLSQEVVVDHEVKGRREERKAVDEENDGNGGDPVKEVFIQILMMMKNNVVASCTPI